MKEEYRSLVKSGSGPEEAKRGVEAIALNTPWLVHRFADSYTTSAVMSSVSDNTRTLTSCSPSASEPQCIAKCSN
jgi:hypothetical protein